MHPTRRNLHIIYKPTQTLGPRACPGRTGLLGFSLQTRSWEPQKGRRFLSQFISQRQKVIGTQKSSLRGFHILFLRIERAFMLALLCHAPWWLVGSFRWNVRDCISHWLETRRKCWIQGSTVCSTNSTEQSHPLHRPQKVCQSGARACEAWEHVKQVQKQRYKSLQKNSGVGISILNSFSVFSLIHKCSETMLQRNLHCSKEPRSLFSASPSRDVDLFWSALALAMSARVIAKTFRSRLLGSFPSLNQVERSGNPNTLIQPNSTSAVTLSFWHHGHQHTFRRWQTMIWTYGTSSNHI